MGMVAVRGVIVGAVEGAVVVVVVLMVTIVSGRRGRGSTKCAWRGEDGLEGGVMVV